MIFRSYAFDGPDCVPCPPSSAFSRWKQWQVALLIVGIVLVGLGLICGLFLLKLFPELEARIYALLKGDTPAAAPARGSSGSGSGSGSVRGSVSGSGAGEHRQRPEARDGAVVLDVGGDERRGTEGRRGTHAVSGCLTTTGTVRDSAAARAIVRFCSACRCRCCHDCVLGYPLSDRSKDVAAEMPSSPFLKNRFDGLIRWLKSPEVRL